MIFWRKSVCIRLSMLLRRKLDRKVEGWVKFVLCLWSQMRAFSIGRFMTGEEDLNKPGVKKAGQLGGELLEVLWECSLGGIYWIVWWFGGCR